MYNICVTNNFKLTLCKITIWRLVYLKNRMKLLSFQVLKPLDILDYNNFEYTF